MARQRLGVAMIGLGMAVTPHAKSLLNLQDRIEVRAAYSPTPARRRAFAERFPFPLIDRLEAILADPKIAVALVLTPPNARLPLVAELAGAGKHVLLEKPIERTMAAAVEVVTACAEAGVHLGLVFQHRYRAASLRLRQAIEDGLLGEIEVVRLTMPWWRPQSHYDEPGRGTLARDGGGVLISQAIHGLDLMLSLAGPVHEVTALATTTRVHRMATEDFVAAGLRFANGAVGAVTATTASYPGRAESLELVGTRATVWLEAGTLTLDDRDGKQERWGEAQATGGGADPMAFPHEWHRGLLESFLDAVEAGRPPSPGGLDRLAVHRLIDALLVSAASGRPTAVG